MSEAVVLAFDIGGQVSNEVKLPRLLDTKQVAEILGVPVWSLRELVRKKKGPPHLRIGRRVRFTEAAVVRWIEEQCSGLPL